MQPEHVNRLMMEYRANKGRCSTLEIRLSSMRSELTRLEAENELDVIYASGSGEKGMPNGGQTSDPTARIALRLIMGCDSDDITALKQEIRQAEEELRRVRMEIALVDGWLEGLKERERFVVSLCVLDGLTYRMAGERYKEKYGDDVSKDTLRNIKKTAVEKVCDMTR